MRLMMSAFLMLILAGCTSAPKPYSERRTPAGNGDIGTSERISYVKELSRMLPNGEYKGRTESGEDCSLSINNRYTDHYVASIMNASYDADNGLSSNRYLYMNAVFEISMETDDLSMEKESPNALTVRSSLPKGGGTPIHSTLSITRENSGQLVVGITEKPRGLHSVFLKTQRADCRISSP